jgi:hypothetical protein
MTTTNSPANPVDHFLQQQNQLDLLRFITCGSVDACFTKPNAFLMIKSRRYKKHQLLTTPKVVT